MAGRISYYGNIVKDGLVLDLDAAKRDSYPGTGTAWNDISGFRNNGVLTNGPTFNSGNGGSIVFDGSNDYASLGTYSGLGNSNRTFDVWYQILSLSPSGFKRIFTFATDDLFTDTPALTFAYSTSLTAFIGVGGTPYNGYISLPFSLSVWNNVTVTVQSNSTVRAFQNGTFITQATNTGAVGANPIGFIGRYNNGYGQYGNCTVASLKVYNRILTDQEVLQNYNATKGRYL